ncbi:MAG: DUF421 domain-containing protein [Ignavibacteriales bacterium]
MKILMPNIDIVLRNVSAILILFILARLMGKKQISQLNFFDYVVGISIGSIAAAFSVDRKISYFEGVISLVIWSVLSIFVAYLSLKSLKARKLLEGELRILIENGRIIEENLRKERFNINDLVEELRMKGIFNLSDVEFALLETSGRVSVKLKSQKQPVTPYDIGIPTTYQGLSTNLIIDGEIIKENLAYVKLDEAWLKSELNKKNIHSFKEVLLASLDTEGSLYISLKNKKQKDTKESN